MRIPPQKSKPSPRNYYLSLLLPPNRAQQLRRLEKDLKKSADEIIFMGLDLLVLSLRLPLPNGRFIK